MKPAICAVCGKFDAARGEWIAFADYQPLPDNFAGHPQGYECFCGEHLDAAKALLHLNGANAIALLRGQFDKGK